MKITCPSFFSMVLKRAKGEAPRGKRTGSTRCGGQFDGSGGHEYEVP